MAITYKTETINPDAALKMLDGNKHNRELNQRHVDKLAMAMRLGEWELNGESIKINGSKVCL